MRVLTVGNRYPPESLGGYELVWEHAMEDFAEAGHDVRVRTTDTGVASGRAARVAGNVHRDLRWYWHDYEFPRRGTGEIIRLERDNRRALASPQGLPADPGLLVGNGRDVALTARAGPQLRDRRARAPIYRERAPAPGAGACSTRGG
jgi:hypothetical protein